MNKNIIYLIFILLLTCFVFAVPLSSSSINWLSRSHANSLYCSIDDCGGESTTYFPYNISTIKGTLDGGNLTSVLVLKDGLTYNVSEVGGADPLTIDINFTDVSNFNSVVLSYFYKGGSGHEILLRIWENETQTWEEGYLEITDTTAFVTSTVSVFDPLDHIDADGNVSIQLYHEQNGNPAHEFLLDYIVLV